MYEMSLCHVYQRDAQKGPALESRLAQEECDVAVSHLTVLEADTVATKELRFINVFQNFLLGEYLLQPVMEAHAHTLVSADQTCPL